MFLEKPRKELEELINTKLRESTFVFSIGVEPTPDTNFISYDLYGYKYKGDSSFIKSKLLIQITEYTEKLLLLNYFNSLDITEESQNKFLTIIVDVVSALVLSDYFNLIDSDNEGEEG